MRYSGGNVGPKAWQLTHGVENLLWLKQSFLEKGHAMLNPCSRDVDHFLVWGAPFLALSSLE